MSNVRDKLKQVATETLQHSGVNAVTFRELGKSVGIKSSSVVYHFKNKDGLLYEIADDYSESFFHTLEDIDRRYSNVEDKLRALVEIFESVLSQGKFCLCGMLSADIETLDQQTVNKVKEFFIRLEQWVCRSLEASENFDASQAPVFAQIIVSGLEGAMMLDKTDNQSRRLTAMKQWVITLVR